MSARGSARARGSREAGRKEGRARPGPRFTGFVPDAHLPGAYAACDVFCTASIAELQTIVTLETLASRLASLFKDGDKRQAVDPGSGRIVAEHGFKASLVSTSKPTRCATALSTGRLRWASSSIELGSYGPFG